MTPWWGRKSLMPLETRSDRVTALGEEHGGLVDAMPAIEVLEGVLDLLVHTLHQGQPLVVGDDEELSGPHRLHDLLPPLGQDQLRATALLRCPFIVE